MEIHVMLFKQQKLLFKQHNQIVPEDQWPNKEWLICSDSMFSNGALHWLVAEEGQSPENIFAFDPATEIPGHYNAT